MSENVRWFDLIEEFRRLGGSADNICLRAGPFGRGVFPVDPSQPMLVRAPENFLLPVEEAAFQGDERRPTALSRLPETTRHLADTPAR